MYIRRTQTRNSATGESYHTHRLVRSTRVGGKVRQITLLNLGRHFAVPPADWPTLCVRLEELLSGQGVLLEGTLAAALEREAQRLGAQLLARQPVARPSRRRHRRRRRPHPRSTPSRSTRCSSVGRARSGWSRWGDGRWPSWSLRPCSSAWG
jgi:hypothetical protein